VIEKTTVKVEIIYSDGSRIRVEGEEAQKWAEGCKSISILAAIHGCPFPDVKWIVEEAPKDPGG
jgi:hypothetical protein